jgi:ubiquitin-like-conjugating enzyme ATG3
MEFSGVEKIVEADNEDEEGWVETTHQLQRKDGSIEEELNDKVCEMTLDNNKLDDLINDNEGQGQGDDDDDEGGEAIDMEEFEESGMLEQVDPVYFLNYFLYNLIIKISYIFFSRQLLSRPDLKSHRRPN